MQGRQRQHHCDAGARGRSSLSGPSEEQLFHLDQRVHTVSCEPAAIAAYVVTADGSVLSSAARSRFR